MASIEGMPSCGPPMLVAVGLSNHRRRGREVEYPMQSRGRLALTEGQRGASPFVLTAGAYAALKLHHVVAPFTKSAANVHMHVQDCAVALAWELTRSLQLRHGWLEQWVCYALKDHRLAKGSLPGPLLIISGQCRCSQNSDRSR